jgi:hypothetical protein
MLARFTTWEMIMRRTILAAVAALSIGGIGAGTMLAYAQPAPPPPAPQEHGPWGHHADGPWGGHRHWGEWMRHLREGHGRMVAPGTFALVYRHADRQLTPTDVQTIAQAFLLWNGNHSWKVVDVAPAPDGAIGFAYATQQGGVIARFTMDPHTGKVARTD